MFLPFFRSFVWRLLTLCICWGAGCSSGMAAEKVVLQLKWRHQFQFAGYYAAIEKGYYKEAGLEVELREAVSGFDPADEVVEGRADFGIGTSNLLLLRAKGHPVVVLAVIYQHSPFVLLAAKDSGVSDIHDMAGQTLMMEPDAFELLAYFKHEGVDPSRLKIVPHTFDSLDLVKKKAGGMSAYSTDEPFHLKAAGVEYLTFSPRAGGIDFYGDNIFTTEKQIREHPERTRAFVRASLRGWEYAMRHPDEIIDLILTKYPAGKTRDQLVFEARETARLVHPELIELGYVNPGRWQSIAATYADLGMLPKDFSIEGFFYEADRPLDLRWLYWVGGGSLAVGLVAVGWSLLTARINRRLKTEVKARKKAEAEAQQLSQAKSRLIGILAHEVRSPLAGILGLLGLYREEELRDASFVETAEASAASLLQMVDNLLGYVKVESGKMQTRQLPTVPREMIEELGKLFHAALRSGSIELRVSVAPSVPQTIITDPTLLRQILANLLSNALKFSKGGVVQLSVEGEDPEQDGQWLSFTVLDSGPGLDRAALEDIFEPYVQLGPAAMQRDGGAGLGLAIVWQFAQLLKGEIHVNNNPDGGAAFTLRVHVREKAAPEDYDSLVAHKA